MKELLQVEKELYDRNLRRTTNENLQTPPPQIDYPDAKKHQIVSFIKSGIRILGYVLIPFDLLWAAFVLALSEVVGIYEELV